jgi:anti-sigma factor RsiW
MSEHDEIRKLLGLAAAAALDDEESDRVARHVRTCAECEAELRDWELLAGGLRRLPTPQPSASAVRRARERAEARLADLAEHRWDILVLSGLIVFAWIMTVVSWPVIQLVTGGLLGWVSPRFSHGWLGFAAFSTIAWIAGGIAALMLAAHHQRDGRIA